jgi:hypothetical protein
MSETPRYLSKHYGLHVSIAPARYETLKDINGDQEKKEIYGGLVAIFRDIGQSPRPSYDIAFASRTFLRPEDWRGASPWDETTGHRMLGATPLQRPQALGTAQNVTGITDAYDPRSMFGVFDLAWIPEGAERELAGRVLDTHTALGTEFIRVEYDAIPLPWPSYPKMRAGQGAHNKVLAFVRDGDYDAAYVIEWEQAQDDTKQGIVNAMQGLLDERRASAEDAAAMERVL